MKLDDRKAALPHPLREAYQKAARNPLTGEEVAALRSRLKTEFEFPMKEEYGFFIKKLVEDSSNKSTE